MVQRCAAVCPKALHSSALQVPCWFPRTRLCKDLLRGGLWEVTFPRNAKIRTPSWERKPRLATADCAQTWLRSVMVHLALSATVGPHAVHPLLLVSLPAAFTEGFYFNFVRAPRSMHIPCLSLHGFIVMLDIVCHFGSHSVA